MNKNEYIKNSIFDNFANYTRRQILSKFLAKYELFKSISNIQGSIIECGVHEGNGLFSWAHLSSIIEPYNYHRKIIGFDTFEGFKKISKKDKKNPLAKKGKFREKYNTFLHIQKCLVAFNENRFINNKDKVFLIKGLAEKTIPNYVKKNEQLIVSLLYLDFDLFKPTDIALKNFLPLMPKGSIVAFDEVYNVDWPGETQALLKNFKLNKHELLKFNFEPNITYIKI